MHKEYKINIMRAGYFFVIILGILLPLGGAYGVYTVIRNHAPFLLIFMMCVLLLIFIFLFFLSLFYFNKLKIYIDDENVIYKMPDKTIKFNVRDIRKIEKDFSYAGFGYYVFFYDDKRKKRHIKFTQDLEDSEELIDYLQKKSGVKMRWEGTVDVKNEKRPVIKVLKIGWNIFITVFMIGALVVWPFWAHCNRDKEQRQHLPDRSLWP